MNPRRPLCQADLDALDRPVGEPAPQRFQSLGADILFTAIVAFFLALCALFGGL